MKEQQEEKRQQLEEGEQEKEITQIFTDEVVFPMPDRVTLENLTMLSDLNLDERSIDPLQVLIGDAEDNNSVDIAEESIKTEKSFEAATSFTIVPSTFIKTYTVQSINQLEDSALKSSSISIDAFLESSSEKSEPVETTLPGTVINLTIPPEPIQVNVSSISLEDPVPFVQAINLTEAESFKESENKSEMPLTFDTTTAPKIITKAKSIKTEDNPNIQAEVPSMFLSPPFVENHSTIQPQLNPSATPILLFTTTSSTTEKPGNTSQPVALPTIPEAQHEATVNPNFVASSSVSDVNAPVSISSILGPDISLTNSDSVSQKVLLPIPDNTLAQEALNSSSSTDPALNLKLAQNSTLLYAQPAPDKLALPQPVMANLTSSAVPLVPLPAVPAKVKNATDILTATPSKIPPPSPAPVAAAIESSTNATTLLL